IGLPATNGFVGEFLVLPGTFRTYPLPATIATAGVVVAAMYLLPALQRVIFNPLDQSVNEQLADLSLREIAVLVPLLACIVWIGVALVVQGARARRPGHDRGRRLPLRRGRAAPRHRGADRAGLVRLPRARAPACPRVLRAAAVRHAGYDAHGRGRGSDGRVPRA